MYIWWLPYGFSYTHRLSWKQWHLAYYAETQVFPCLSNISISHIDARKHIYIGTNIIKLSITLASCTMKLNAFFLKPLKQCILLSYTKTFAFPEIDNTTPRYIEANAFECQLIMRALEWNSNMQAHLCWRTNSSSPDYT